VFADLWLKAHEVTVPCFSFAKVVKDSAEGFELVVVLCNGLVLLEAVELLACKKLAVAALETLEQEVAKVLPGVLSFGGCW